MNLFIILLLSLFQMQAFEAHTEEESIEWQKLELDASINEAKGDFAKVESMYRELLKIAPENKTIKFKLAEVLSWNKKFDESIQIYEDLLKQNPSDSNLRRKYAMVLLWMGKDSEAAEQLQRTLQ